ncbi:oxidoreductase, 2OG-Fe(II) oxygenase family protein [Bacteriovorax sp. DB6_IX]|nr:oxidoreductase, 2OG-Fe(II) oxygenase family protein [Bacteriovorax sp. DB6_IX]
MQFDMFGNQDKLTVIDHDGEAIYYPDFFSNYSQENLFEKFKELIAWRQDQITLYGKTHNIPRLQAWYGDKGAEYAYSGIKMERLDWESNLEEIKKYIEGELGLVFNSCLCNLYRDGKDYAAWHSDDEKELGATPTIASASFGETRKIVFKHKSDKGVEKVELELEDKSLLIMSGPLQHNWKHQLNKTQKKTDARINLTFRHIVSRPNLR